MADAYRRYENAHGCSPSATRLHKFAGGRKETALEVCHWFSGLKVAQPGADLSGICRSLYADDLNYCPLGSGRIGGTFTEQDQRLIDGGMGIMAADVEQLGCPMLEISLNLYANTLASDVTIFLNAHAIMESIAGDLQYLTGSPHIIIRLERSNINHFHCYLSDCTGFDDESLKKATRRIVSSRLPLLCFPRSDGSMCLVENMRVTLKRDYQIPPGHKHTYPAKKSQCRRIKLGGGTTVGPDAWYFISKELKQDSVNQVIKLTVPCNDEDTYTGHFLQNIPQLWKIIKNPHTGRHIGLQCKATEQATCVAFNSLLDEIDRKLEFGLMASLTEPSRFFFTAEFHPASGHVILKYRKRISTRKTTKPDVCSSKPTDRSPIIDGVPTGGGFDLPHLSFPLPSSPPAPSVMEFLVTEVSVPAVSNNSTTPLCPWWFVFCQLLLKWLFHSLPKHPRHVDDVTATTSLPLLNQCSTAGERAPPQ